MGNPAAAPSPLSINGKEYMMCPATDEITGELDNRLKKEVIRLAQESLTEDTPEYIRKVTMEAAFEKAAEINWMRDPEKYMDAERMLRLFFGCIKPQHNGLVFEEFLADIMADPQGIAECYNTFLLLHPMLRDVKSGNLPKAGKPKAKDVKSRKKKSTGP